VHRDAKFVRDCLVNAGNALIDLLLAWRGHVFDRHMQGKKTGVVDPMATRRRLGQAHDILDALFAQPLVFFQ
jgi:hypothetical protein